MWCYPAGKSKISLQSYVVLLEEEKMFYLTLIKKGSQFKKNSYWYTNKTIFKNEALQCRSKFKEEQNKLSCLRSLGCEHLL